MTAAPHWDYHTAECPACQALRESVTLGPVDLVYHCSEHGPFVEHAHGAGLGCPECDRNTPLGNMVLSSYGFPGWEAFDQSSSAACLRSRQLVSEKLCGDVTNLDENTFRDLGPLRKTHEAELQGLQQS